MVDEHLQEIRVIETVASRWEYMAVALDMNQSTINTLSRDFAGNALGASLYMFSRWIDSCTNVTWELLVDALNRADYKVLADKIEQSKKVNV